MSTQGAALRERRLQSGLSQTERASRAGVSRQLIAALEAGRNTPSVDAALRLARVGDQLVAAELADHGIAGADWAKPDAVSEHGRLRWFPGANPAGTVIAGCDPAFGVAERMLEGLGPRSLLAISAPMDSALRALRRGRIRAIAELLNTAAFTERVGYYGGYDLTHCGEPVEPNSLAAI